MLSSSNLDNSINLFFKYRLLFLFGSFNTSSSKISRIIPTLGDGLRLSVSITSFPLILSILTETGSFDTFSIIYFKCLILYGSALGHPEPILSHILSCNSFSTLSNPTFLINLLTDDSPTSSTL